MAFKYRSFTSEFYREEMMEMSKKEIFLIEHQGKNVLFAPLKGIILEIRDEEKNSIVKLLECRDFSFEQLLKIFPEIEKNRLLSCKIEDSLIKNEPEEFLPTSVVLFTTFNCHLRCIYCYSDAGKERAKTNMSWEIAKSAIDLIIKNAEQLKEKECSIEFHGGGEPTWNWSIFRSSVIYFQGQAQEKELTSKISLVTNGILSEKQIEWIVNHGIQTIQISLDGTEEIHDFQRPTARGGKSFAIVYRTIKLFLAKGVDVMLHSVVTYKGVNEIPEIVRFFGENFPRLMVQIEPAVPCGRGLATGQQFPSAEAFASGFIEALDIAKSFGIDLIYSGTTSQLTEIHENFCGASQPNFVVTPTGIVSACHEVAEPTHALADFFVYGRWNQINNQFIFDYQKIQKLRSVIPNPICDECFARFYCAGDCLAKNMNDKNERSTLSSNSRCKINRELTKHYIFSRLYGDKKEERHERSNPVC